MIDIEISMRRRKRRRNPERKGEEKTEKRVMCVRRRLVYLNANTPT